MKRYWWMVLALLVGLVITHDLSMAMMGHPVAHVEEATRAPGGHDAGPRHHHDDAVQVPDETIPESCGTVRLAHARQDVPDRLPLPDLLLETGFEPCQTALRAISANLLANPVPNSPSACLARFQVFRI